MTSYNLGKNPLGLDFTGYTLLVVDMHISALRRYVRLHDINCLKSTKISPAKVGRITD